MFHLFFYLWIFSFGKLNQTGSTEELCRTHGIAEVYNSQQQQKHTILYNNNMRNIRSNTIVIGMRRGGGGGEGEERGA